MGGGAELGNITLPYYQSDQITSDMINPFTGQNMGKYSRPDYKLREQGISDNLGDVGTNFLESLLSRQNQGLPEELKTLLKTSAENSLNSGYTTGKRLLQEQTAGKQLPTGALTKGFTDLATNRSAGQVQSDANISLQDYQALQSNRDKALAGFMGLQGLASNMAGNRNNTIMGLAGMQNNYNSQKYQTEKANEFSWGDALGDVLGAGGKLAGAAIGKK